MCDKLLNNAYFQHKLTIYVISKQHLSIFMLARAGTRYQKQLSSPMLLPNFAVRRYFEKQLFTMLC